MPATDAPHVLAALPIAIPLAVAVALLPFGHMLPRLVRDAVGIATAVSVSALLAILLRGVVDAPSVAWMGGRGVLAGAPLGIALYLDAFGVGLALLAALLTTATFVFSWRYFEAVGALFHSLVLVFLAGMIGFCLTGDLFNLFVFLELMSVPAYALTAYKIEEPGLMGAFNFAVTNSIGAFMVLGGLALLYGRTGQLNLAAIGASLAGAPPDGLLTVALMLLLVGLFVKADIAPFHFWLADAHAVAPTPVCVLFSGVMVEVGVYGIARLIWAVFAWPLAGSGEALRALLLGAGALTAVVGATMAYTQRNLKRLLAFSTVGHSGVFLLGVALLSSDGLAGTALYALGHGFAKGSLFVVAGIILNRFGSVDEVDLRGRGREAPVLGVLLALGGFALAAAPFFGTEPGKRMIEESGRATGSGWIAWVALYVSVVTGAAVLRAAGRIFAGLGSGVGEERRGARESGREEETRGAVGRTPVVMLVPAVALLAACVGLSFVPGLESRARVEARRFEDSGAYVQRVLGNPVPTSARLTGDRRDRRAVEARARYGRGRPRRESKGPSPAAPTAARGSTGAFTIGGAAGALGLALMGLYGSRFPLLLRGLIGATVGRIARALEAAHTGNIGDYVTWLTAGACAVGAVLVLLMR